jgi:membrane protease YdiL (CAAX protease family)
MEKGFILQEMSDGVLTINQSGEVTYCNPQAMTMLDLPDNVIGQKLITLFVEDPVNEGFVQSLLDAVYHAEESGFPRKQMVPFQNRQVRRMFEIRADYSKQAHELIAVISDVTERERAKKERKDAAEVTFYLFCFICFNVIFYKFLGYVFPGVISRSNYSKLIILGAIVLAAALWKRIRFPMNVRLRNIRDLRQGFLIGLIGVLLLCMIKILLRRIGWLRNGPFVDFSTWSLSRTVYPLSVIAQEILSRSVMYDNLKRVFVGPRKAVAAILVSSLMFSTFHIAYPFPMLVGSFILLSLFGVYYEKTKNLWSLCLIHYMVGITFLLLRFV